ncbi:histidine kinase [Kushneria pakistanensis]|uniref:Sensor protein n=1 Tax=Kushneria pakistanensis TaxID=1508770 RepID=A0ABQ3FG97_9GAMM|nr:histidine kinase [Kushneria pakistanensis]GHC22928.1 histidine kinase [Kushneria pakistanensis]
MGVFKRFVPSHYALSLTLALVLAGVSLLALGGMVASGWLADTARHDARVINQAGSLRMQTWRLMAQAPTMDHAGWRALLNTIDDTWQHLDEAVSREYDDDMALQLGMLRLEWVTTLHPDMRTPEQAARIDPARIAAHVSGLDGLTGELQALAETRIARLRALQVALLLLTLPLIGFGAWRLHFHVRRPLGQLLGVVETLRAGDLQARTGYWRNDEIGLLAATIDDMAGQLEMFYRHLNDQVEDRAHRLQQSHLALTLLYDNARYLATTAPEAIDPQQALQPFEALMAPAELALVASQNADDDDAGTYRFPLQGDADVPLVLVARLPGGAPLPGWKCQICETLADHLDAALALRAQGRHKRRLALMDERAVIARELHDSLAQSLSYLNIQALRLARALPEASDSEAPAILGELREGIAQAYRQLRELLVTFRLRLTEHGINAAVRASIEEFAARGELEIDTTLAIADDVLAPDQELHLVQILREALANVVQHARAQKVTVTLTDQAGSIDLVIEDDGVGLPAQVSRSHHYGTIIMAERARSLGTTLVMARRDAGGTRVALNFINGSTSGDTTA